VKQNSCAQCGNPIEGRQAVVRLVRADLTFHGDCWTVLNLTVQREYEERAQGQGLVALLDPYRRARVNAWLPTGPDAADDSEDSHDDDAAADAEDSGAGDGSVQAAALAG
jgi:hypothetical protein